MNLIIIITIIITVINQPTNESINIFNMWGKTDKRGSLVGQCRALRAAIRELPADWKDLQDNQSIWTYTPCGMRSS